MHWCVISLVAVTLIAIVVRFLSRKLSTNATFIIHVDEFVGNVCTAVFMMELGVVATMYGQYSAVFAFGCFVHLYLKIVYFCDNQLYANPLAFVESYYNEGRRKTFSVFFAISIIATQLAGLCVGQEFAKAVWAYEDHDHIEAMQMVCRTSLSPEYTILYAALLEGFGCLVASCLDYATPAKLLPAQGAFTVTFFLFLFGHVNGMYMNPSLATAFSFRCEGHSGDVDHLLVYWLLPLIGVVMAREVCWFGGRLVAKKQEKEKKIE